MFGYGRSLSRWAFSGRFVVAVVGVTLIALTVALSLSGCGGGGGGPSPAPAPKLSGSVTAPQGTSVAQAPSLLQRLASLLISVAQAQVLQGQAVANATVKAFIWPNVAEPIAIDRTDDNGRYKNLQLPPDAVGKDIVVIAEKGVQGGTLRLSTIVADVPREGKTGVDLDAATTLAAEQIAKFAKDKNISDLSPNAIAVILSEVRKIVASPQTLQTLNLVVGAQDSPLPQKFGEGLSRPQQVAQVVQQVENTVTQQQQNLPAPTGDIAIAKSIVQMLRDFGVSVVNLPETEVITLQAALAEQQQVISNEIQIAQEFSKRINFPTRVLGLDSEDTLRNEGSPNNLIGKEPGQYREVQTPSGRVLDRIGNAPDDKTWIVTSALPETNGMQLTVTVQNPIGIFRYTHEAGIYTFQVRKPDDASLQYDGSIAVTVDSQGNPTQVALNATVKDSALKTPITFSGTLQGTPTQTGSVAGVIRSPAIVRGSRTSRSRQSSGSSIAPYKEAKFVNVTLQSQYGSASIGELKVVWLNDSLEPDKLQQISLTNLQATSQTSKPASLVINTATVELQPTTQQEKQQYREDLKPKTATFSATIEGSGVRLQVSNMQASDFVFVKVGGRWNGWTPVPRSLTGQVSYSSRTLSFNGSVNARWENLQGPEPAGFGEQSKPVALLEVPKGTFSLQGNWTPNIGKPAGINLQMTSNPQGNAPHVTIQLTLNYGDQKLSGTITGTLDIRDGQSYGFKAGNLNMTHSSSNSPSNFKVQASAEIGKATSGQIVTAQGEKVADIGEARNLGMSELGSALVVRYKDNTFETLESVLPRSRVSRR